MRPTFHWAMHYPNQLARHGLLPTSWLHERKNNVAKPGANNTQQRTNGEKTLHKEVRGHTLGHLNDAKLVPSVYLSNPYSAQCGA